MRPDEFNARRGVTLLVVSIGTFMLLLDVTVVNVALPDIQHELDAGIEGLQWVIDAYALALAALMLIAGSLADRLGRRALFAGGLLLFTAASLFAGLAGTATLLDIARAAQGAGGAAILASGLALIANAYPVGKRQAALAVWGAVSGTAFALGPLIGGILVEGFGWRSVFIVNVPVGLAGAGLTLARVRESRDRSAGGIDWLGAVLLGAALTALVFGLLRGNVDGWSSPQIVTLLAGAPLLLAAFIFVERAVPAPMLQLGIWGKPTTAGAALAVFAIAASAFAMFVFLSLYLQNVLGYGPLGTGLRFLPLTVAAFVATAFVGRAGDRAPARWLLALGLTLIGVGLLLMREVSAGSTWTALLPGFCCVGLGIGLVNPVVAGTAIAIVEPNRSGMASGLNNTFRLLGMATGVAVLGAVFQHRVSDRFLALAPVAPQEFADAVGSGNFGAALDRAPVALRRSLTDAAERAFVSGLDEILLVGSAVALLGAVAAVTLVRRADIVGAKVAPSFRGERQRRPRSAPL